MFRRVLWFLLFCYWFGHRWVWCRTKPNRRTRVTDTSLEYLGCRWCGRSQDGLGDMTRYSSSTGNTIRYKL